MIRFRVFPDSKKMSVRGKEQNGRGTKRRVSYARVSTMDPDGNVIEEDEEGKC